MPLGSLRRPSVLRLPLPVWAITGANMTALGALTAPAVVGLPSRVADLTAPEDRAAVLATIIAAGSVAALIAAPMFGFLSDRTRLRFGRRRPWLLLGSFGTLTASLVLTSADSLAVTAGAWVVMQALSNATMASADAMLADTVDEPRRAFASGVYSAATFVGTLPALVLLAVLPDRVALITVGMAALASVVAVTCAAVVRDAPADTAPVSAATAGSLRDTLRAPGFIAVWLQKFLMQLGCSLAFAFTLYFIMDRMSRDTITATPVASATTAIAGAAVAVAAAAAGIATARRGDYRLALCSSAALLALGASLHAVATTPTMLWGSVAVGGIGFGTFLTVNLAMALRTIPAASNGLSLGLLNVATATALVAAPSLAALLVGLGGDDPISGAPHNYVLLYLVGAVFALSSLAALPWLRGVVRRRADLSPPR